MKTQLRRSFSAVALLVGLVAVGSGCSATDDGGTSPNRKNGGQNGGGGDETGAGGGGPIFEDPNDDLDPPCRAGDPNADFDGDGYTPAQGDCNDCDPRMNPGAYDFPGNNIDEDCNGVPDDEPTDCDVGLPQHANDPFDAAKALGLCRVHDPVRRTWGVKAARWVLANGAPTYQGFGCGGGANPQSRGILTRFGPNVQPRHGSSMVALSTGIAREGVNGSSPAGADMGTCSPPPPGFPYSPPSCKGSGIAPSNSANDTVALELEIQVPTNARSFSFDLNFYTYEFPDWICSDFNDFFVALLYSKHPGVPSNKNISFDKDGNPISVNNAWLDVCKPSFAGGKQFACPLGTAELQGTGFEGHAATSWLQTRAGVVPGEHMSLRFAIWDTGDHEWDSTVLLDNFQWDVEEGTVETEPIR